MIDGLFNNTTIPILKESINFAQARHNVLVSNVANMDTPGYVARDLPVDQFQQMLAEAVEARRTPHESSLAVTRMDEVDPLLEAREVAQTIMRHDGVNVGMEQQVLEISKNQMLHNLAITVMGSQFRLLQTMVSEHL